VTSAGLESLKLRHLKTVLLSDRKVRVAPSPP
jgi:hypothetical protein